MLIHMLKPWCLPFSCPRFILTWWHGRSQSVPTCLVFTTV